MANPPLPKNLAVVSSLDPTYTLTDVVPNVAAIHLPAYLRFHYLFLGPLVIPRTYLIHGRYNPFMELYRSDGHGKEEILELLTSGTAFITGHDNPSFQRLQDHLAVTASEQHPLVFDYEIRAPLAEEMNGVISPERIVTLPAAIVTNDFKERFKSEYSSFSSVLTPEDWDRLDKYACMRLKERNKVNVQPYPEDKWGRNEVCDYIVDRAKPNEARYLTDCAVAAYQRVFATSTLGGTCVLARSVSTVDGPPLNRLSALPFNLTVDPNHSKNWEFDFTNFGSRPWKDIKGRYDDADWQDHLTDFRRALADFDSKAAANALTYFFEILSNKYPVQKNSRITATLNLIASNLLIATVVDVISAFGGSPLVWYVMGTHASVCLAAYVNKEFQRRRRDQNLNHHLNFLLEPIGDHDGGNSGTKAY